MITKTIQITELSVDELADIISDKLLIKIKEYLKIENAKKNDILLTRTETAKFLKVSEQGLHMWNKKKILVARKIGSRVYYLKKDILDLIANENME